MIKNKAVTGPFSTKQKPTLLNWENTNQQTSLGSVLYHFLAGGLDLSWLFSSKGEFIFFNFTSSETNKQIKPPGFLNYHPLLHQINNEFLL